MQPKYKGFIGSIADDIGQGWEQKQKQMERGGQGGFVICTKQRRPTFVDTPYFVYAVKEKLIAAVAPTPPPLSVALFLVPVQCLHSKGAKVSITSTTTTSTTSCCAPYSSSGSTLTDGELYYTLR